MTDTDKRLYEAIIWRHGPDKAGERVSVLARDLNEARSVLEDKYGKGHVFNLHNPDDAKKAR